MKIAWQLDTTLATTLQWGETLDYAGGAVTTTEYGSDHQHAYTLTGLTPGTRYYYRVLSGASAATGTFYTAPAASATNLKFFAYGDTRTGTGNHNAIAGRVNAAYLADPAFQTFNLAVGDLVYDGDTEAGWDTEFFDPQYTNIHNLLANISFLSAMGNHEGTGNLFTKYFALPFVAGRYWSFDYGPAHVAILDQYTPYSAGSTQYNWLVNDLAGSTKTWKFIVVHEPGWTAGGHPNNTTVQTDIQPLAETYGVAIVFGGHTHYYARAMVNGVCHLVVGGGGAPLHVPDPGAPYIVTVSQSYSFAEIVISGNTLTGTAVQSDGTPIETFVLTR